jgi:hypothetical protein
MSNAHNYLPDCFDHQLWLILVDIMAAVFGHEEACVRDERRQIFVRRTQDRFQCVRRKPLRLLRQVERTRMGENCQWHRAKWRGRGRLAHHGVIFSVFAVARDGLYRVAAGAHVESHQGRPPLRRQQRFGSIEGGLTTAKGVARAAELAQRGIDAIEVSYGVMDSYLANIRPDVGLDVRRAVQDWVIPRL